VVVGDHRLDPGEPAGSQRAQERRPEGTILGVTEVDTEHLTIAGGGSPGGHDDGSGDDPTADAALDEGGIDEHVRELDVIEPAGAERFEVVVELDADPRHLRLRDAGLQTEGLDEVIHLPR